MRIDALPPNFIPEKRRGEVFQQIVESGHDDIGKRVREYPDP